MANHKSAKKRAKQNTVKRERNKAHKSKTKTLVKKLRDAISAKNKEVSKKLFVEAQSLLAKLGKLGINTKQTASRQISRLASQVNQIS